MRIHPRRKQLHDLFGLAALAGLSHAERLTCSRCVLAGLDHFSSHPDVIHDTMEACGRVATAHGCPVALLLDACESRTSWCDFAKRRAG